eukprot:10396309-Heterocapsa_arctica.AAC.1
MEKNTSEARFRTHTVAETLKDGTLLCRKFNRDECTTPRCSRSHKCNLVKPSGRICGGFHSSSTHIKTDERSNIKMAKQNAAAQQQSKSGVAPSAASSAAQ